ncbi:class I SAM-dependent methyltransferase [Patescibacteria group bacterium]|nr:class I SAM-dependent methyltransferase [Patescibacteria group bacterium]
MNIKEINQILELNKEFYQLVGKDFSKTRQKPWEGWGRVIEIIRKELEEKNKNYDENKVRFLDIGCGNGRFFKFLWENIGNLNIEGFEYTGVDINNDLLEEATRVQPCKGLSRRLSTRSRPRSDPRLNPHPVFIKEDIFKNIDKIPGKYNVVTAFGVTHHIPDNNFRKAWFSKLPKLLKDEKGCLSMLALTFWDFEQKPGDYFLGWKENEKAKRYCHKYSKKEIENLKKMYKNDGLNLINEFEADNKNLYLIFGKI